MILVLQPDAAQQDALTALVAAQHDPESPQYQQWLTPESFGQTFGASERDIEQVVNWLQGHGFDVEPISAGRGSLVFSGTTAQVESAFHTQIHVYDVGGEIHHANSSDPEIPIALAPVVQGLVSLHDFQAKPQYVPDYTSGTTHYMSPADFATIYNLAPLYAASNDGTGQSIAIVGRTNLNLSDVQTFRSKMGLPPKDPTIILNGADPGIVSSGELGEATLDVEWSGAVAKNATILFVVSGSTHSTDGVDLSAQYIVTHNLAPILSLSFGSCEAVMGASENQYWNSLWQQAAAQGMSVFVASGDSGAAGCDSAGCPHRGARRGSERPLLVALRHLRGRNPIRRHRERGALLVDRHQSRNVRVGAHLYSGSRVERERDRRGWLGTLGDFRRREYRVSETGLAERHWRASGQSPLRAGCVAQRLGP